jgi:hypothetical protein
MLTNAMAPLKLADFGVETEMPSTWVTFEVQ